MKSDIKVHEVTEAPAIGKVAMMGGIRTKEAAEKWARANFFTEVWFWKARERVYAQKHSAQPLLAMSEQGKGRIGLVLCVALFLWVLIAAPASWKVILIIAGIVIVIFIALVMFWSLLALAARIDDDLDQR